MTEILPGSSTPQFGTAEYKSSSGPDRCKSCDTTLTSRYFRINGALACENCAERLKQLVPKDSRQAFVRGIVFGLGGAFLGLILYAAFGIITGLVIGYLSLAVGYIVGKAIKMGSGGMGGRRYQIAAALLTYAAVSMAAIPIGLGQYAKQHAKEVKANPPAQMQSQPQQADQPNDPEAARQAEASAKPKHGLGAVLLGLALLGLVSPILELQNPIQGMIGLVILFVGIRIAWQLTAGTAMQIIGPFNQAAPTSVSDR